MDGIYPSNTGYAMIAKRFIEKINSPYGGTRTIGIQVETDALDSLIKNSWSAETYRDIDGDGYPAGPETIFSSDGYEIESIDPELLYLVDCYDNDIASMPEAVSAVSCF